MLPAAQSVSASWVLPILAVSVLVITVPVYLWGWFRVRSAFPDAISGWRLGAFLVGALSAWAVVGSPVAKLDHELLLMHMVRHLILMTVSAPLILLGESGFVLASGLPPVVQDALTAFFHRPAVRWVFSVVTRPVFCWFAATVILIGWHVPILFALGMRSGWWHGFQSACFFGAGLLFWWPVLQPWPSASAEPRWSTLLYLFSATLPCDALSAFLAFCGWVVYPCYRSAPQVFNISPLQDQEWAAALMWVWVTFVYLVPAVGVTLRMLAPARGHVTGPALPATFRTA